MIILGIETSCDETALALIEVHTERHECRIINSLVHSQADLHSAYGGVYPTLAKREHGKNIIPLLHKLLYENGNELIHSRVDARDDLHKILEQFKDDIGAQNPELFSACSDAKFLERIPAIDTIAVTEGPGLEPALWVGINTAKILSALWHKPIIPVNHMEGHIVGSLLEDTVFGKIQKLKGIDFPALALLISGGHTELVHVGNIGDYKVIGSTKDDAVGEAFDKIARILGLSYPGGPHISRLADEAEKSGLDINNVSDSNVLGTDISEAEVSRPRPRTSPESRRRGGTRGCVREEDITVGQSHVTSPLGNIDIKLPRPMMNSGTLDFSFSGLKTAVLYAVRDAEKAKQLDDSFKKRIALEFEHAVTEVLTKKTEDAIEAIGANALIVGGGVSANTRIRRELANLAHKHDIPILLPTHHISGDNALMIALAAGLNRSPHTDDSTLSAKGTKRL